MSLFRCAYCGSPNLKRTKADGEFSYKKAIVGTAVFGAVGAVAGINGKEKYLYSCPDCGEESDHPMDSTEKMVIDSMVSCRTPLPNYIDKYAYLKKEMEYLIPGKKPEPSLEEEIIDVVPKSNWNSDDDSWFCLACKSTATGNFCNNCGTARPKPVNSWICPACGNQATGNFCNECGASKSKEGKKEKTSITELPKAKAVTKKAPKAPVPKVQKVKETTSTTQSAPIPQIQKTKKITGVNRMSVQECARAWDEFANHFTKYIEEWDSDSYLYLKENMNQLNALAEKIATNTTPVSGYCVDASIVYYHFFVKKNNAPMTPYQLYHQGTDNYWGPRFNRFVRDDWHSTSYTPNYIRDWFDSLDLDPMCTGIEPLLTAILEFKSRHSFSKDASTAEPRGPFGGKNCNKLRSGLWIEDNKLYVSANACRELDYRDLFHIPENVKKYNKTQESIESKFATELEQMEKMGAEIDRLENKLFGKKKAEQLRTEYSALGADIQEKKKKLEEKNRKIATEISKLAQEINAVQLPSMKDDSYWVQIIPNLEYEEDMRRFAANKRVQQK